MLELALGAIDWAAVASEYGKIGIISVIIMLVLGTNTTVKSKLGRVLEYIKFIAVKTKVVVSKKEKVTKGSDRYLNAVSLLYQLREQCIDCQLEEARVKLEEVFPLLCQSMRDESKTSIDGAKK